MENTDRDTATTAPQTDWQDAETIHYGISDEANECFYAAGINDDEKEEEENQEEQDNEEDEEEDAGDWGHVDPEESHNPFSPDPNEPTAPGSAV